VEKNKKFNFIVLKKIVSKKKKRKNYNFNSVIQLNNRQKKIEKRN
jgi:hypothetical protein